MKKKICSKPNFVSHGNFAVLRFVPGDHVRIEFDAWSFVEIVVMDYWKEDIAGEKPSGKEEVLPF